MEQIAEEYGIGLVMMIVGSAVLQSLKLLLYMI